MREFEAARPEAIDPQEGGWSATPPTPDFGTSTKSSSGVRLPWGRLKDLLAVGLALAVAATLYIGLRPGQVGIINSSLRQGERARHLNLNAPDLGFPSLSRPKPRVFAAAPVDEVMGAGVDAGVSKEPVSSTQLEPASESDQVGSADNGGQPDSGAGEGHAAATEVATPVVAENPPLEVAPPVAEESEEPGQGDEHGQGQGQGQGQG
ncbi:MAG TPA: hypothetical protein VFS38_07880, partial [Actinomycetota bacterium]|nr:hypothetical protein [Actinomycetota bacterium]